MSKFLRSVLIVGLLSSFAFAGSKYENVDWEKFSENVNTALKSDNTGLKFSAMLNLIKYSDQLSVDSRSAVISVMREFKHNESETLRRLSLITLYKMKNEWAIYSLKRQYKYADDTGLNNAIAAVVLAYENE